MSNDVVVEPKREDEELENGAGLAEEGDSGVSRDLLKEMIQAGLWYGRKKNRTHPRMKPFIFMNRNGIEIIDLVKTAKTLDTAIEFIKQIVRGGGNILFISTQPSASAKVEEIAKKHNQPYITNRWLGGIMTNFETISKRIEYFKKLKSDKASGALDKYTKKEQVDFGKEIVRLSSFFSGIENMTKLPGAVFMINISIHETALREAIKLKIPVIAVISTDVDPNRITYPIPGNDSSVKSVEWIMDRISVALAEAQAETNVARLAEESRASAKTTENPKR